MYGTPDPYGVLGVPRDAPPAAVKRAYRQLALRWHPDVAREADARDRFQRVQEAYETLSDPHLRAELDAELRLAESRGPEAQPDVDGLGARAFGSDVRDAIQDVLESFGLNGWSLTDLLSSLPRGAGAALRQALGAAPGDGLGADDGRLEARARSVRVLGGGEIEVDLPLSPLQASAGVLYPFEFHLGPHLVEETLRIPSGVRTGQRHLYRIPVDPDLTLRVTVCVVVG